MSEMSEDEACRAIQDLQDAAMPTTIPKLAAIIKDGRERGETDIQIATRICDYIFAGEPKQK